eukprot:CAMPEP_0182617290 /NCGR_PEP_ID=MMETSP1330-20130603/41447_1 /TAXON_ID=464278 /ORGANISM="Picochlorum sp., Strain RCC944" /LENGTH=50 /DNA_ID=CAMNT_0024837401 /DNA_START=69 /DNA_END=221 /DNA_ORIENTATION=-
MRIPGVVDASAMPRSSVAAIPRSMRFFTVPPSTTSCSHVAMVTGPFMLCS